MINATIYTCDAISLTCMTVSEDDFKTYAQKIYTCDATYLTCISLLAKKMKKEI